MEELKKICKACLKEKPLCEFHNGKWGKNGKITKCKTCIKNKIPLANKQIISNSETMHCPTCNEDKSIDLFYTNKSSCRKCIITENVRISKEGNGFTLKTGEKLTIKKYIDKNNVTVEFESGIILENVIIDSITKGWLKNPYYPRICKVGYVGVGKYSSKSHKSLYNIWSHMIRRCYGEDNPGTTTTYKGITVCKEWHNFQNYAQWYEDRWKPHMQGWHVDKDIICKECKIYSPETCRFVPRDINNLFKDRHNSLLPQGMTQVGDKFTVYCGGKYVAQFDCQKEASFAYKIKKEMLFKEAAEKWKNEIDEDTYEAIINYKL